MRKKFTLQNAQEGDILQVLSVPKWGKGWIFANAKYTVEDAKVSKVVVRFNSSPDLTFTLTRGSKFFKNLGPLTEICDLCGKILFGPECNGHFGEGFQ